MIQIDKNNLIIEFLSKWSEDNKTPPPNRECRIITCYVCPQCDEMLKVYYETDGQIFNTIVYAESGRRSDTTSKYLEFRTDCGFGAGLSLKKHGSSTGCKLEIVKSLDMVSVTTEICNMLGVPFEPWLIGVIYSELRIPGLYRIPDITGRDLPLIGFRFDEVVKPYDHQTETWDTWNTRSKGWQVKWVEQLREACGNQYSPELGGRQGA